MLLQARLRAACAKRHESQPYRSTSHTSNAFVEMNIEYFAPQAPPT
jgi:hypothetical protein